MNFEKPARRNFYESIALPFETFLVYEDGIEVKSVERMRGRADHVRVTFIVDLLKRPIVKESTLKKGRFRQRTVELIRQDLNAHPENPPFGLIWQRPNSTVLDVTNILSFVNAALETSILPSDLMDIVMTQNPIVLRIKEESLFYFGTVNVNLL